MFTAAKLFAGLGSGSLGPSVMTYMSEISLFQFRGVLLSVFSLSFALGQFINAIATQIVNLTHPNEYKRVFYSEFAIVGVWLGACLYLPESPGKPRLVTRCWIFTERRSLAPDPQQRSSSEAILQQAHWQCPRLRPRARICLSGFRGPQVGGSDEVVLGERLEGILQMGQL